MIGIAGTVVFFVVHYDGVFYVFIKVGIVSYKLITHNRVLLNESVFFLCKLSGLPKNLVGNFPFADIVVESAKDHYFFIFGGEFKPI